MSIKVFSLEIGLVGVYKELEEAKRSLEIKLYLKTAYEFKRSIDNIKAQIESKEEELKESIHGKQIKLKEVELEKENLQKEIGRKLAFISSPTLLALASSRCASTSSK